MKYRGYSLIYNIYLQKMRIINLYKLPHFQVYFNFSLELVFWFWSPQPNWKIIVEIRYFLNQFINLLIFHFFLKIQFHNLQLWKVESTLLFQNFRTEVISFQSQMFDLWQVFAVFQEIETMFLEFSFLPVSFHWQVLQGLKLDWEKQLKFLLIDFASDFNLVHKVRIEIFQPVDVRFLNRRRSAF